MQHIQIWITSYEFITAFISNFNLAFTVWYVLTATNCDCQSGSNKDVNYFLKISKKRERKKKESRFNNIYLYKEVILKVFLPPPPPPLLNFILF